MKLRCNTCRKEKSITEEDFMKYLSCGWTVCHGEAMELITEEGARMSNYNKGDVIKTAEELMSQEMIWFGDKVYHKGWFQSWQFRMVMIYIKGGKLVKAVLK